MYLPNVPRAMLLWTLALPGVLPAQTPRIDFESVELPPALRGVRVNALLEHSDGPLWIATDRGLCAFDGHHDVVHRHEPDRAGSLPHDRVNCLVEDPEGTLWVGTAGGLCRLRRGTAHFESVRAGEPDAPTRTVCFSALVEPAGRLWFATNHGLLTQAPGATRIEAFEVRTPQPWSEFATTSCSLASSADGVLWIGSREAGLGRIDLDDRELVFVPPPPGRGPAALSVHVALGVPGGDVFCGTSAGLYRWSADEEVFEPVPWTRGPRGVDGQRIRALHRDRHGHLWLGGVSATIQCLRGDGMPRHEYQLAPQASVLDMVNAFCEDRTGALWVGANSGVYRFRYDVDTVAIYPSVEEDGRVVLPRNVRDLAVGMDGALWLATQAEGLWRLAADGDGVARFPTDPAVPGGLPTGPLNTLCVDERGVLWIGTAEHGLCRFDAPTGTFAVFGEEAGLGSLRIATLIVDRRGGLWVGTRDGVYRFDRERETFARLPTCDEFPRHAVDFGSVELDRDGQVWMGLTNQGLMRIDPEAFTHEHFHRGSTSRIPFPAPRASALCASHDGSMWAGTLDHGLFRLDPAVGGSASRAPVAIPWDDRILGLHEDEAGDLWIFQADEPARLTPGTGDICSFHAVLPADFLIPMRGSIDRTARGEVYLGGWSGFVRVDTRRLGRHAVPLPIRLTAFALAGGERIPLDAPDEDPLYLPWERRAIAFQFDLVGDPGHRASRVQYRLLGLDPNWHEAGRSRGVAYGDLEPGAYILEVRATSSLGIPSPVVERLEFVVEAPFWRTPRFLFAGGALTLLVLLVLVTAWRRTARAHRDEVRALEERMQRAQKLESLGLLAGGVAHDFNNLLTVITGNASLAAHEVAGHEEAVRCLQEIENVAARASQLTRQMLDFAGSRRECEEAFDLSSVVRELDRLLRSSVPKKALVRFELADDLPPVIGDPSQLQQVVLNLVRNASEALEDRAGTIAVRTGMRVLDEEFLRQCTFVEPPRLGPAVFLSVEDDGCGIEPEHRERIFDPFFTTKFTGRGLGLASVFGIVRRHGGAIQLTSRRGAGTQLAVFLPAAENAARTRERARPGAATHGSLAGCTVLVVDDEVELRTVARRILEEAGARVVTASDGQVALDLLAAAEPRVDVVLLDLMMPRAGGLDVLERLVEGDERPAVVLCSGYTEESTAGVTGDGRATFLGKPYTRDELLRAIDDAWRSPVRR